MSQGREQAQAAGVGPGLGPAENGHEAPTQRLGLAAVSDRCTGCGAPLSSDQRYCVNCGERRGHPRFTLAEPVAPAVQAAAAAPRRPRRARASSGFTLIAGIATLLIAMGVGVLIGHNNTSNSQRAASAPPINLNVGTTNSGVGSATTPAASPSTAGGKGKHSSKGKARSARAAKAKPSAAESAKAASAATKVLGGSKPTAPATVTQGGACSSSAAGCQNGKFTGGFFGGG
jgi:hypothetical protein